ncbi:LiaI-LiaF-like domain-containing protein [Arcticibacter sp. MXS-1]|uniref:LiaF transmembrane domain-containing protein n=1 Tax=Arcticibacter sp. MXS-1 TaxID=3341726 RepID=UPI0035A8C743
METANTHHHKKPGSGKQWAGLILLVLGVIFLIRSFGDFIPGWITSWPMILIILGIFSGVRNKFRNPGAFILIFIGTIFLAGRVIPGIEMHDFVFPVIIMGLGLYLILGRKKNGRFGQHDQFSWDKRVKDPVAGNTVEGEGTAPDPAADAFYHAAEQGPDGFKEDYLDTVSVFGGIKKNIFSKDFRGGDIVTIMGGAEINLSQSDIHGPVVIDITQVFGGTKLIIPPQWKVSSDLAALFGGIEDKRPLVPASNMAEGKVLILRGTSVFGGIDIRSF